MALRSPRRTVPALAMAVLSAVSAVFADVVIRRDGARIEGVVHSVDAEWVVVDTSKGRSRVPRDDVASIAFDDAVVDPPLTVEVRVARADDAIDVYLDDEPVVREVRARGSWTDIAPRLKEGNHELRFRIRNERGPWSYRVLVRINGRVSELECGGDGPGREACTCCGLTGYETGWIDDIPPVWIHVDRELGRAEILR